MKHRHTFHTILSLVLFLVLVPTALASTTWYVDGVNGSDNNNCKSRQHACKTIGHAIALASSGDSIMVAPATYTENLHISISLKILGSGANTTIIDGGGRNTVVKTSKGTTVALANLTFQNGSAPIGGGGIFNGGTMTISNSTISGSKAPLWGGGISNGGKMTINNSSVSGNTATGVCGVFFCLSGSGGGISNGGALTINNSTLSGNLARSRRGFSVGGGISTGGTMTISNSTLSGNSAHFGGGINGTATFRNSIVANSTGGNCYGTVTSNGYNLSSDGSCSFNSTGDLNNTDPKLGTLGNYGGPTQTIPLLSGSPAIDAGNPGGCTDGKGHLLKTDQRGKPRPDKEDETGCDMGAFEKQSD